MYVSNRSENEKIQIPKNYSGNAFRESPQEHENSENQIAEIQSEMHRQDLPRLSPPAQSRPASPLSSILPSLSLGSNFPFGHGLGSEELFILGMMLLVYTSGENGGEVDSELLLLLCILLFSG